MTDFDRSEPRPTDRVTTFVLVGVGIAATFLLHGLAGGAAMAVAGAVGAVGASGSPWDWLSELPLVWMMTVGLSQVCYVAPIALLAAFVRPPLALGMAIGAALTLLLQGACYGFVFASLSSMH